MTWMILRLVLSLAFVGGILWFAARVAKKRGLGGSNHGLIEVVARQRIGRSSSVNVVRVGDVVLVVGATEEQITLLAEVDNETIGAAPIEAADVPAPRVPERTAAPAANVPDHHPRPQPSPRRRYDGDGFDDGGYAEEGYRLPERADRYDPEGYAPDGYGAGYAADQHGYQQPYDHGYDAERVDRRPAGHHAEGPRHGSGQRRPIPAQGAQSAALAGSVFDKNGWGTFVNELRERTVRRP